MTPATDQLYLAVLVVCHNRRETTLRALKALQASASEAAVRLQVVLFDDHSSDGTAAAVKDRYPEVIVLHGSGETFWNGGLHAAWKKALSLHPDGYLWLNDDVELDPGAMTSIKESWTKMADATANHQFILVGATRNLDGSLSYSGERRRNSALSFGLTRIPPAEDLLPIDTFNGNIVVVPSDVVRTIGINDPGFLHNLGDIDYGLRATAAGISVLLLKGTLGYCEFNWEKARTGFGGASMSILDQWRVVNTFKGLPFRSWFRFTKRHSGLYFILHFLSPYRRLLGIR